MLGKGHACTVAHSLQFFNPLIHIGEHLYYAAIPDFEQSNIFKGLPVILDSSRSMHTSPNISVNMDKTEY